MSSAATATMASKLAAVRAAAAAQAAAVAQRKQQERASSLAQQLPEVPRVLRFKATQHRHGLAGTLPPLPLPVPKLPVARMRSGGSLCSLDTTASSECQVDLSAGARCATPDTAEEDDKTLLRAPEWSFPSGLQFPEFPLRDTDSSSKTTLDHPRARFALPRFPTARAETCETENNNTTCHTPANENHERDNHTTPRKPQDKNKPAPRDSDVLVSLTMMTSPAAAASDELASLGLPAVDFDDDALFADLPPLDDAQLAADVDLLGGLFCDDLGDNAIVVDAAPPLLPPPPPPPVVADEAVEQEVAPRCAAEVRPAPSDKPAPAPAPRSNKSLKRKTLERTPLRELENAAAVPSPSPTPTVKKPKLPLALAPAAPRPAALPPPTLPGAPQAAQFDELAMQIVRQRTVESRLGAPRLVVQIEPMEQFYKDEGGAANFLFAHVELHGELDIQLFKGAETPDNIAANAIPLGWSLELEDGTPLPAHEQRAVLRMVEPPALSMSRLHAVVKYRLLRVSKNFGGQRLRLVLWLRGCPGVQPVSTVPVRVFSKRKKMCSAVRNRLTQVAVSRHVQRHLKKKNGAAASPAS